MAAPALKLLVPVGAMISSASWWRSLPRGWSKLSVSWAALTPSTGTRVVAVADGKVVKLFNSKPGGLTVYQFDASDKYAYYYAHLDRYAEGLKEGAMLKRGELLGYVGATGNANPAAPTCTSPSSN